MKILVMGGTRFVGRPLVQQLQDAGHALTLFTRGKNRFRPALSISVVTAARLRGSRLWRVVNSM